MTTILGREDTEQRPHEDGGRDWMRGPQAEGCLEPPRLGEAGRTLPGAGRDSTALPTPGFRTSALFEATQLVAVGDSSPRTLTQGPRAAAAPLYTARCPAPAQAPPWEWWTGEQQVRGQEGVAQPSPGVGQGGPDTALEYTLPLPDPSQGATTRAD